MTDPIPQDDLVARLFEAGETEFMLIQFFDDFSAASEAMERAAQKLHTVMSRGGNYRVAYDRTHKQMKRIMRDWNRITHQREVWAKEARVAPIPSCGEG